MSSRDKTGLPPKVLAHFNIKYQMAFNLLIPDGYFKLRLVLSLKRRADVAHLFADRVPPQRVTILSIKLLGFLDGFGILIPNL
jgi:hypothetical protein